MVTPLNLISSQALFLVHNTPVTPNHLLFSYTPVVSCSFQLRSYLDLYVECPSFYHYYYLSGKTYLYLAGIQISTPLRKISGLLEYNEYSQTAYIYSAGNPSAFYTSVSTIGLRAFGGTDCLASFGPLHSVVQKHRPMLYTFPICWRVTTGRNLGGHKSIGRQSRH